MYPHQESIFDQIHIYGHTKSNWRPPDSQQKGTDEMQVGNEEGDMSSWENFY
jgi:hypothetical protein